jgi:hypothetical protein
MGLIKGLDPMPDEDYYQVHVPKKNMLYDMYVADCVLYPKDFTLCQFSWFNHIWTENHSNVRLRKHCRFAKCDFCVKWRAVMDDQTKSTGERANARCRIKQHIDWTHTRERAWYHSKRHTARTNPQTHISVAMDGTAQMGSGMPHFMQKIKGDGLGARHKFHTQIVLVHGSGPQVFLGAENIAGDPNWTIDTLYRTLKREEESREHGLPDTLYLQLDNCSRENKNTYVLTYCAWLVERGVFTDVFVSFLPVGHTHFDPDQFASRIAQAVKYKNLHSVAAYVELIKHCYNPQPEVVVVDRVMDTKVVFNPTRDPNFHPSHSNVLRTSGCCTPEVLPGREWYMDATTPLHWRMRRCAGDNSVIIQAKHTCDDVCWSASFNPWSPVCPRPDNRPLPPLNFSGLLPSDLKMTAPTKEIQATRKSELRTALDNVRSRISHEEWADVQTMYEEVTTAAEPQRLPEGFGSFWKDDMEAGDAPQAQPGVLLARQHMVLETQQQQNAGRIARGLRGHASEALVINNFVAYPANYTEETKEEEKQDFWVGQIVGIDVEDRSINIKHYNTGTKKNLESQQAKYTIWASRRSNDVYTEVIGLDQVLETFQLTKGGLIVTKKRKHIKKALELYRTNLARVNEPVDLGVGFDYAEGGGD